MPMTRSWPAPWPILTAALVLLASASAAAYTEQTITVVCPITGKRFDAVVAGSGTMFGVHLDMRPVGPIAAPDPVPVCPDASRFPVFKTLTDAETAQVRQIVATPEYRALIATGPQTYYVIAHVKARLGENPVEVAQDLVQASWQAPPGSEQHRLYLRDARTAFEAVAATPGQAPATTFTARYFEAELSRQLGDYDRATAVLDRWFPGDGSNQAHVGLAFLAQERAAIGRRDAGPVRAVPPGGR